MVNIYQIIFYSAIILHVVALVYYVIATIVSVTGILAKHKKLNRINLYVISIIIILQVTYGFGCPLTVWQNFAADRMGAARINSFVTFLFDKLGWHIEAMTVLIIFIILNFLILGSYVFYKYKK